MDGYIRQVLVKSGDKVSAQAEAVRMDDSRLKLILDISRRLSSNLELQVLLREAAASVRRATQSHGRLIMCAN